MLNIQFERKQEPRPTPRLSTHAVHRWNERAQPVGCSRSAYNELEEFVRNGHRRPIPRSWTTVRPAPGLTFVYWAERPDVCALVKEHTVVTILTRSLCRGRRFEYDELVEVPCTLPARRTAPAAAEAA
jgi:hypothetical protein